jgi:hypothetical protein
MEIVKSVPATETRSIPAVVSYSFVHIVTHLFVQILLYDLSCQNWLPTRKSFHSMNFMNEW